MTLDEIMTGLVPGMTHDRIRAAEHIGIADFADQTFACRVVFGWQTARETAAMRVAIAFRDGAEPPDFGGVLSPLDMAVIRELVAQLAKRDIAAKAKDEGTT